MTYKIVALAILFLIVIGGSQELFSKETLVILAVMYIGSKLSFYVLLFSMNIENNLNLIKQKMFLLKELAWRKQ